MKLNATSVLAIISTALRMLSGVIVNKAISVFIGPAGLATIGQFQNIQSMLLSFSQAGINTGVTKYISSQPSNEEDKIISTAMKITFACSLFISVIILFSSSYLSEYVFDSEMFSIHFKVFSLTIFFYSFNQLVLSIINGRGKIKNYLSINILQSIYSLLFTSFLIFSFKLDGAIWALVTNQAVITIFVYRKFSIEKISIVSIFKSEIDFSLMRKLFSYSLMSAVLIIVTPTSYLIVRNIVDNDFGANFAGYWQGVNYISSMYISTLTSILTVFYLPKLSKLKCKKMIRAEVFKGTCLISSFILFSTLTIFYFQDFVIRFLFSADFLGMKELFPYQIVGMAIKGLILIVSYLMLSKAMTSTFIVTEILYALIYILSTYYFTEFFGFVGAGYAFVISNLIYVLMVLFLLRKQLFFAGE
ncbi:O-antigen translocase [Vibrio parahaemolyticus]|uniref:Lipid III flippase n=2 Tax=Vibrio parahaemolyticus TaxID=670 RepID=A0A7M1VZF3_VIBPH|nr:O-antigen translocase [Vibrio parahaemolyticus]QOS17613.1 lipid III flippase [Vibrio parahaemolyticus]QOS19086.1 lipid III flippase [Vibrio parahaemolyticus]QOS19499.1 lipid III flippase [Vibrio parahaemolyticus]QOS20001.1 lipid III flippase [Vibrio parahaemolyticus]QOS20770.1 lipid III flippase [Vibrio parahaemolyticus]